MTKNNQYVTKFIQYLTKFIQFVTKFIQFVTKFIQCFSPRPNPTRAHAISISISIQEKVAKATFLPDEKKASKAAFSRFESRRFKPQSQARSRDCVL